jgi:hypothetical protein
MTSTVIVFSADTVQLQRKGRKALSMMLRNSRSESLQAIMSLPPGTLPNAEQEVPLSYYSGVTGCFLTRRTSNFAERDIHQVIRPAPSRSNLGEQRPGKSIDANLLKEETIH